MRISFVGHSVVPLKNRVIEEVKAQLRECAKKSERITCYLGGYGDFDELCAFACREMKEEYAGIETVYVTPYMGLNEQKKIKCAEKYGIYDASIYPLIENVPPKFAIIRRNEWMMVNADLIIAYVAHNYGGAYKSLQIAKKREKKIINIYELMT